MYWAHIGVFGGLGNIEALGERLWVQSPKCTTKLLIMSRERDLRALCPTEYEVGIFEAFE
jgi:actin-related protein 6